MKKLFTLALCAIFAATAAEAKTYYVNASRPNNNGNGLKPTTAKKTIQAAINLAKDGDTILVYPGQYYAPIKTNDKKITIKSVKGSSQTKIVKNTKKQDIALAQLGKPWTESYVSSGSTHTYSSAPYTKGKNTTLSGFLLDGKNLSNDYYDLLGVSGGTVKSCSIRRLGDGTGWLPLTAANATLLNCTVLGNQAAVADTCVLTRCKIKDNEARRWNGGAFYKSRLSSCLVAGNRFQGTSGCASHFTSSTLVNCTIADNKTSGYNSRFSKKSTYYNCILRNNRRGNAILNVNSGNTYNNTDQNNQNPKFVNAASGDYKLAKGSPCINKGAVPAAIRSYVGSLDLAGQKRIKGKAIDRGCYEY